MAAKKTFPVIELSIDKLSTKGNGLGHYLSSSNVQWKVEVPFSMPGDVVRAKIFKKKNGVHWGFLEEIVSPGPFRQKPKCAHFGICGGCRLQHIEYSSQLDYKEASIQEAFKDIVDESTIVYPIVPSDKIWQYRNKMEFSFSQDLKGERFLGLIMDSSRGKVMNITECHLVREWFAELLTAVRSWWAGSGLAAYHPNKNTGSLRVLTVREGMKTKDKLISLTVSGNPDYALNKEQLDSFVQAVKESVNLSCREDSLSIFLRIQQTSPGMATNFYEMHLFGKDHIAETLSVIPDKNAAPDLLHFHISPNAFFQPNTYQAEKFYSSALQMAGITKQSIVYDLYCGTGTIGLSVARHARQVIGIELSPESALDARSNAALNKITNYSVICGAVRHVLKSILEEKTLPAPDVLLIDPPRAGLDPKAIDNILAFQAQKIVYISCNPKTQALNVAAIIDAGYRVVGIQPVDQFPHTVHVENIVVLEKLLRLN